MVKPQRHFFSRCRRDLFTYRLSLCIVPKCSGLFSEPDVRPLFALSLRLGGLKGLCSANEQYQAQEQKGFLIPPIWPSLVLKRGRNEAVSQR